MPLPLSPPITEVLFLTIAFYEYVTRRYINQFRQLKSLAVPRSKESFASSCCGKLKNTHHWLLILYIVAIQRDRLGQNAENCCARSSLHAHYAQTGYDSDRPELSKDT